MQRGHRATLTPVPTNSCSSFPVCMMRAVTWRPAGLPPFSGGSAPLGCPKPGAGPLIRLSTAPWTVANLPSQPRPSPPVFQRLALSDSAPSTNDFCSELLPQAKPETKTAQQVRGEAELCPPMPQAAAQGWAQDQGSELLGSVLHCHRHTGLHQQGQLGAETTQPHPGLSIGTTAATAKCQPLEHRQHLFQAPGCRLDAGVKGMEFDNLCISSRWFRRSPRGGRTRWGPAGRPGWQHSRVSGPAGDECSPFSASGMSKGHSVFHKNRFRGNWPFWLGFLMVLGNANMY